MKALVLSAGGSFGGYQIGAWRALQESNWQPDFVIGASIGAVNGLAISRGASASDLLRLWRDLPLSIQAQAGLSDGAGRRRAAVPKRADLFQAWLQEVFDQWACRQPKCGLYVALTEWPSCSIRIVSGDDLESRHLLATCAVPMLMPPVRIGQKLYMDGGTFCLLPLRQAILQGASEIVAVDVLAHSPCKTIRWMRLAATGLRNFLRGEPTDPRPEELAAVKLLRIHPGRTLGTLDDCFAWDLDRIDSLVEAGYQDARRVLSKEPFRHLVSPVAIKPAAIREDSEIEARPAHSPLSAPGDFAPKAEPPSLKIT